VIVSSHVALIGWRNWLPCIDRSTSEYYQLIRSDFSISSNWFFWLTFFSQMEQKVTKQRLLRSKYVYIELLISKEWILSKNLGQFYQRFTSSFFAQIPKAQKDTDDLAVILCFWDLWAEKLCINLLLKLNPYVQRQKNSLRQCVCPKLFLEHSVGKNFNLWVKCPCCPTRQITLGTALWITSIVTFETWKCCTNINLIKIYYLN